MVPTNGCYPTYPSLRGEMTAAGDLPTGYSVSDMIESFEL
jgi:hypothetical protein